MTKYLLKSPPQKLHDITASQQVGDSFIEVVGAKHEISRVSVAGGDYGLKVDSGATDLVVNDFTATNQTGYGLYIGQGSGTTPNSNLTFNNLKVELTKCGEHCVRIYAARDVKINNFNLRHTAPYGGATLNVKQISGLRGGGNIEGQPPGFGPNETNAKEDAYIAEDIVLDGGKWNLNTQIVFWANLRRLTLKNLAINVLHNEVFTVRGAIRTRKEPLEITIDNCQCKGTGKLFTGNGAIIKFLKSGFNGKVI